MSNNDINWFPHSLDSQKAVYLAIVDAIENDLKRSVLKPGDKLPPQRKLAYTLGIDFTTVTRAYQEGKKRGLLVARMGQGTFIRQTQAMDQDSRQLIDMGMNIPPLPTDKRLIERMQRDMAQVVLRMGEQSLFGYQDFFGTQQEREIASNWVGKRYSASTADNLLISAGSQAVLLALLSHLIKGEGYVCSEEYTYPGFKAVTQQLNIPHIGLAMDHDGILPTAFEKACRSHHVRALYCTPTQHNPTTTTWSMERRRQIAEIATRYDVWIIEDDAYGFISDHAPTPLSSFAPERSFYIAGLAKTVASSLRIAFLICPDEDQKISLAQALRATSLMASAITKAMAIDLIQSGIADQLSQAISDAARERQAIAREMLETYSFRADPNGFHIWLPLPPHWPEKEFVTEMRRKNIRLIASDAFAVSPKEATGVRLCLGAPDSLEQTRYVLHLIAQTLKGRVDDHNAIV